MGKKEGNVLMRNKLHKQKYYIIVNQTISVTILIELSSYNTGFTKILIRLL